MFMNIVSAAMAGLTVSATMAGHTNIMWALWCPPHCERRMAWLTNIFVGANGWPHCERRDGRSHYVLWAPDGWPQLLLCTPNSWLQGGFPFVCGRLTAVWTFSCGRLTAGLTEVYSFRLNILSPLWAPDGWHQLLLLAPDGFPHRGSHPHQSVVPSTPTYLLPVRSDRFDFSVRIGGGGSWLDNFPQLQPQE